MQNKRGEAKVSSYIAGSIKSSGENTSHISQHVKKSLTTKSQENQTLGGKFKDLPLLHLVQSNSVVEAQYRKEYLVEWCEECLAES